MAVNTFGAFGDLKPSLLGAKHSTYMQGSIKPVRIPDKSTMPADS